MKLKDKNSQASWALLPYNISKKNNFYLLSTVLGSWSTLSEDEFKQLQSFQLREGSGLFNRLRENGVIVTGKNLNKLLQDYRNLNRNLFVDASLFIMVVTTRCNLNCRYCQTAAAPAEDMNLEVATKMMDIIFSTRNRAGGLEFQGGEPLLNWPAVRYITEYAKKYRPPNKDIALSLVTNGLALTEDKVKFLARHDVNICISLDGPRKVHDKNRILKGPGAKGSYQRVVRAIRLLKAKRYPSTNLLPTITRSSFPYYKEIIDEYVKWGETTIALRPTNRLGRACGSWARLDYTPEEFHRFWSRAMDYLLHLNRQGVDIKERITHVILQKIFKKTDPGYVDLSSPCGSGRSVLAFTPSGDVYPCDEARMLGEDIFKLGNVLKDSYPQLMSSPNLFYTCQASLLDIWDYASVYKNWSGTCPVLNYAYQHTPVAKLCITPLHKIINLQFDYIFDKINNDEGARVVFKKWVGEDKKALKTGSRRYEEKEEKARL